MAWTASLLFLAGGLACLAAVIFPVSRTEPVGVDEAMGLLACGMAALLWLPGRRLAPVAFEGAMAIGTLIVSTIVARATTSGGAMLTAFAYPWIAVYAAHFFPRRSIVAHVLLISAGFGAGLLIGGLPHMVIDWVIVTLTVAATSLVLGNLSESLRRQADTDQLTGLLNRKGFVAAALRERALSERTHQPLTVAVLDLDGFKEINDKAGHAAGDRLLGELARGWRARMRAGDILARQGGDEFALLLPATAPEGVRAVLDHMRIPDLEVSWSAGVAQWLPEESLDACLARADRDLYGAKEAARSLGAQGAGAGAAHPAAPSPAPAVSG